MARRRSKWRRTTAIVKKMIQEARRTKAYESLRQCPMCGNPHTLSIDVNEDKAGSRKSAFVRCASCGFEYAMDNLPPIADVFWIYSKILDQIHGSSIQSKPVQKSAEETEEEETRKEEGVDVEVVEEKMAT
ncbi:MAG: hypothetical protein N3D82_02040 [Ignisphaera sp.]|nr:hypothetical protein [Ignisphaera sp.]MCX8167800.1 hypothetical protein [Ignisphaera sp.]MDW8086068.1 hypothetical protein [Ignisphaera sp.]